MTETWKSDAGSGLDPIESLTEDAGREVDMLPALLVMVDRVAHTVAQGLHGRRRAGPGEAFWQFRRYRPGDLAAMIDWRKSAKSNRYLIREKEWEAANTVWLWADLSASMDFKSDLAPVSKRNRAMLLSLALGTLLNQGGERIGALGSGMPARSGRTAVRRIAEHMVHSIENDESLPSLPEPMPIRRFSNVALFGDFLEPLDAISNALAGIAARDVRGHMVQILDPAEETFPYTGRTEFSALEGDSRITVGRAELLRGDYHDRLENHRAGLREMARRLGWTFTSHHTDRSPQSILLTLHGLMSGQPLHAAETAERSTVSVEP